MKSKSVMRLSFILLFVVFICGAYAVMVHSAEEEEKIKAESKKEEKIKAESKKEDEPSPDWSISRLRNEQDKLDKEIRDIEYELQTLDTQKQWLDDEKNWNDLYQAQKKAHEPQWVLNESKGKSGNARRAAATSDNLDQVGDKIKKKNELLKDKKAQKYKIENAISQKIDLEKPKQNFKMLICVTFAVLIGLMILGFFFIAWRDDIVRREIFHGQAGIQFITLFSLVIAIILFGILDILGGKELAALLGGLSGYILGRVTTPSTTSESKTRVSSPAITGISPNDVKVGTAPTSLPVQIVGNDLQLASSVKIVQGTNEVLVSDITSNDRTINCKLTLNANQQKGNYDVIVTNTDGGVAKLPQAFTVK